MLAITIAEILKYAEKFESDLAELYTKISEESNVGAVRLLADYMSRRQNRIKDALSKMPPGQVSRILHIPLQYEPHIPGEHCFEVIKLPTDASANEILNAAIQFDECIVQMFRQISHQPVHRDVKDFAENLQHLEENDQLELEKIKVMFADSM